MERRIRRCSPSRPMERVFLFCAADQFLWGIYFFRATLCMGLPFLAAVQEMGPYSRSTPTAQDLQTCIVFRRPMRMVSTLTAPACMLVWPYQATPCMERHKKVVVRPTARCLPSTPTEADSRRCIV